MSLLDVSDSLSRELSGLSFSPPVAWVYDPLDYARDAHRAWIETWGGRGARTLLVGMNPGPWGMAQTGVPFGAVPHVRDWLRIDVQVGSPEKTHPKRPVEGFACTREEVSGARLWGWAEERFGTPERFFERFWVTNYCPLLFLEESGRNLTPDKIRVAERRPLLEPCDRALARVATITGAERVIGIGAFAQKAAKRALRGTGLPIGRILHPSPASPIANRGWAERAEAELRELGVDLPD